MVALGCIYLKDFFLCNIMFTRFSYTCLSQVLIPIDGMPLNLNTIVVSLLCV